MGSAIVQALMSGRAVLVTGAGFSAGASDVNGDALPVGKRLAEEIWPIAFGNTPYDAQSALGEIFRVARTKNSNLLRDHLELVFRVSPERLPHRYVDWFAMPWHRIYTLNIDDLDQQVEQLTPGGADLNILSARRSHPADADSTKLSVIHLNGDLNDYPDVTFDPIDFGRRSAMPDAWYEFFVNDLVSRPIFFVGTALDEPPLWHYLSQRGVRGPGPEMRPKSWFITRDLPTAKAALLKDFNIDAWEGWECDFYDDVVAPNKTDLLSKAAERRARVSTDTSHLVDVGEALARNPKGASDFLLGFQPEWGDVFDGFAVEFDWDRQLLEIYRDSSFESGVRLVTGNAGAGKTTSMMRLAAQLVAAGKACAWLDSNTSESIKSLRSSVIADSPDVLFIDDVDRFGETFPGLLAGIRRESPETSIIAGIRSHRLHALQIDVRRENFQQFELENLSEADAQALAKSLERGNRLGALLEVPTHQRASKIVGAWNGQLIVALIGATSGKNFQEMIASECAQLANEELDLYAVIAVAESSGTGNLSYDDALFAGGPASNTVLAAYRRLKDSKIVRESGRHVGARHRVVAEAAVAHFRDTGLLKSWVNDLLYLFAVRYDPAAMTQGRYGRLLIRFLNHDFLRSLVVDIDAVGWIYGQLEEVLAGEFHYWLQRGSFELDTGNFEHARVFLSQARVMRPDDILGDTAWFMLQLTEALKNPSGSAEAMEGRAALDGLHGILLERPKRSPHTYDVFLSSGRRWFSNAPMTRVEKLELRERLFAHADAAERLYPLNDRINSSVAKVRRLKTIVI